MRKSDLYRSLQATAIAVPGKGGSYAVVPHPAPASVDVPACAAAFQMARRELNLGPAHAVLAERLAGKIAVY